MADDVALLVLAKPSRTATPIRLPPKKLTLKQGQPLIVAGWGATLVCVWGVGAGQGEEGAGDGVCPPPTCPYYPCPAWPLISRIPRPCAPAERQHVVAAAGRAGALRDTAPLRLPHALLDTVHLHLCR